VELLYLAMLDGAQFRAVFFSSYSCGSPLIQDDLRPLDLFGLRIVYHKWGIEPFAPGVNAKLFHLVMIQKGREYILANEE
jgi:hypothetical protein